MTEALTKETPGKVFSLLAMALVSLSFMFAVSLTDASFAGTSMPLSDPFAPAKVVQVIDNAAFAYSKALSANFLQPLAADYRLYADNLAWAAKESGLTYFLGVENLNSNSQMAENHQGKVAGVSITTSADSRGFNIDSLYEILIN